jgi:uncharacterized membrane protein
MKYKIELEINLPIDDMLELFQDMDFMKKWQTGFVSLEVLEGEPGTVGSKSKLVYVNKGKTSEIIETIIKKELPNEFNFIYEAKGVKNWAINRFVDKGNQTIWIAEHEFKFSGFMLILSLFKGMFVKQTTSDMNSFKDYAEKERTDNI